MTVETHTADPGGGAPPPPIGSRAEFVAALHWALQTSVALRARRIVWVDRNFAEWPLDDAELHDTLAAWLRLPQRRLVLLAGQYDELPSRHPRFTAWRRLWAHAIETWSPSDVLAADDLPTLALDDSAVCVHLVDMLHWRGRAVLDAREARRWRDRIDALLQHSSPAFPANALGL
jgi:hypothetical protein